LGLFVFSSIDILHMSVMLTDMSRHMLMAVMRFSSAGVEEKFLE
jgi:hypothetical protein